MKKLHKKRIKMIKRIRKREVEKEEPCWGFIERLDALLKYLESEENRDMRLR